METDWRWLVGRLCTALNITPAAAWALEWPEVRDLHDYWSEWPPVHESAALVEQLMAAYLGVKKTKKAKLQRPTQAETEAFLTRHSSG